MRTITLELLRHGPPHNQLLSPLTQYLALCENHAAVSIHLPFEHNQFLHRLRALSYELGDEARKFQLRDTALEMCDLLGKVPGMVAELNRERDHAELVSVRERRRPAQELTHMRLVISASELALLPFELSLAPHGFPGAGQHMLLQSQQPICLTRETRRVPEQYVQWPAKPKILFAAASPPSVGAIPVESHLLAFRKLIDPWVKHWETEDERRQRIEEYLVFLPDATAAAIEAACSEGGFTHVHILAHGLQYVEGYDVRYGLALHNQRNPDGPPDIVTGERLATALRAAEKPTSEALARPIVVTLASCHSGNVGTVVGMGASIAHALHEAGIPMVVAGQFPISFQGSVLMVEVLYDGLLWGEDPRISLNDLRRKLHSLNPTAHDWASLVAYASLPPQFDQWLGEIQIERAMRGINVAMEVADQVFDLWLPSTSTSSTGIKRQRDMDSAEQLEHLARFERIRSKIDAAMHRLEGLLGRRRDREARICGLLASTEKRRAEAYLVYGEIYEEGEDATNPEYAREFYKSLVKARDFYWRAFQADRANGWGIVQYLCLDLVIKKLKWTLLHRKGLMIAPPAASEDEHNRADSLWSMANVLSLNDLRSRDETRIMWALTNLIELQILGVLIPEVTARWPPPALLERAVRFTQDFVQQAGEGSFAVYSTRRQILRYLRWFARIAEIAAVVPIANAVLAKLPEGAESDWGG